MIPYFSVFVLLTIFHFIEFFKNKKNLKYILFLTSTLILILFAGLRKVGVGTDDYNYFILFNEIPSFLDAISNNNFSIDSYHKEYGFIILNLFIKNITDNYILLFISISFIAVGLNAYNYRKYSPYIFLTLLLYFVHTYLYRDLNQIRAGIAAAIGLFTIPYIYKREFLKFAGVIFLGALFHLAIFSLVIVYLVNYMNINRKKAILIVTLSIVLGVVGISSFIINSLPSDLGSVVRTLNNYAQSKIYAKDLGLFNITSIKSLFIFSLLVIFYRRLKCKIKYFDTLFLFYTLGVGWRFAFHDFAILAGRIATFFEIVEVVIIPSLLLTIKQRFLGSLLIILYAFLVLYMNLYMKGKQPYELSIF